MRWYTFFVTSGKEDIVCDYLECILAEHQFITYRLMVPKRELVEYKSGTVFKNVRTLFPGYILIGTASILKIYQLLKSVWHSDMYILLHSEEGFQEVRSGEINHIIQLVDSRGIIKTSDVFLESERVLIKEGPLCNYSGTITKVNRRKHRAKIAIEFMNRNYEVDIAVNCLTKINQEDIKNTIVF